MRILIASLLASTALFAASDHGYRASIERWRHERLQSLEADDGWLTVPGLFWLKPGLNRAGADASCPVRLPRGPAHIGDFLFQNGKTTFQADSAVPVKVHGARVRSAVLRADNEKGGPDEITVSDFTLFVIHRGDRYGVRLRDEKSEYRRNFTGLHWYPVNPEYRVMARFVPYDAPHTIAVPNILGQTAQTPTPGYAVFKLHGRELRLDPVVEENQLFFIFRDQTSGKQTYGSGRFVYADLPKQGGKETTIVLDFNKAYSPPCAFTPYATCPLPPKQNRLPVAIEAGELKYGNH